MSADTPVVSVKETDVERQATIFSRWPVLFLDRPRSAIKNNFRLAAKGYQRWSSLLYQIRKDERVVYTRIRKR